MLLACKTPEELDISKLLAIYRSDSLENCRSMYPEEPTVEAALARYEAGYAAFMRNAFFARPGRLWMVETEDGLWASALRLLPFEEANTWKLEALATHPDHRRRGYAARLLADTIRYLEEHYGVAALLSSVGKSNTASLQTQLRAGFVWEGEAQLEDGWRYTMAYRSPQGDRSAGTGASSVRPSGVTRQS